MSTLNLKEAPCPYCGTRQKVLELSIGFTDCTCEKTGCQKKWHEGVFRVLMCTVVSREKRGLGKDRGLCGT
ncbi:MAG: hypothetical protein ACTSSE_17310 [Candidatus Thorarchaeota archaeon]